MREVKTHIWSVFIHQFRMKHDLCSNMEFPGGQLRMLVLS